MRFILALLLLPTTLFASGFALLKDDVPLSREETISLTGGQTLDFYGGGQSRYSAGGAYSYTYEGGGTAFGRFTVSDDGTVCIDYHNGRSRCDRFVYSHGRVILLTEDGQRFAVRP